MYCGWVLRGCRASSLSRLFPAGRAAAALLPAPVAAAAQQEAHGGASGTALEESSLDGMFTASLFDMLPNSSYSGQVRMPPQLCKLGHSQEKGALALLWELMHALIGHTNVGNACNTELRGPACAISV